MKSSTRCNQTGYDVEKISLKEENDEEIELAHIWNGFCS